MQEKYGAAQLDGQTSNFIVVKLEESDDANKSIENSLHNDQQQETNESSAFLNETQHIITDNQISEVAPATKSDLIKVSNDMASSSSKTSSSSTLYKSLNFYQSKLSSDTQDLKPKMLIDLDKIYSVKHVKKIVSFDSSTDRATENYDFLFSADVATPSMEVPEIFNLFGSSTSLINNQSVKNIKLDNFNFNASTSNFNEQIPLNSIFSKRSCFLNSKNVPTMSSDEA